MQRGQSTQATEVTNAAFRGHDGMLITLKVVALLAGYALFVWVTMTQLERRYVAPAAIAAGTEIGPQGQTEPIPGSVEIRGAPGPGFRPPG